MLLSDLARRVDKQIGRDDGSDQTSVSPLPGLLLLRHRRPTTLDATFYSPVLCLILQGRKETIVGDRTIGFGSGESLIVSHGLPVVSRVVEAAPERPYLAMILSLDLGILRSLYNELGETQNEGLARSAQAHQTDTALLDALGRHLALADNPIEAKVMTPLIRKEIHFRLLLAPHGTMLRQLASHDSHASNIARAIERIRASFRGPLVVPELAQAAGMSPSSFHKHFKSITETTPLQYQKDLRLLEARRLLQEGQHSVTGVAFEVGYESPTQFSREYARKFGASPRNDIATTG